MAILRKAPKDFFGWYDRWRNNRIYYDIWFKGSDVIIIGGSYYKSNVPQEICVLLNK